MEQQIYQQAKQLALVMGLKYQRVVERYLMVGKDDEIGSVKYIEDVLEDLVEVSDAMNYFK
jgi:hypothetical protein